MRERKKNYSSSALLNLLCHAESEPDDSKSDTWVDERGRPNEEISTPKQFEDPQAVFAS